MDHPVLILPNMGINMQFLVINSWSHHFVLRDTSCVSREIIACTSVVGYYKI